MPFFFDSFFISLQLLFGNQEDRAEYVIGNNRTDWYSAKMIKRNSATVFTCPVFNIEQMDVEIGCCGFHTFHIIHHPGGAGVLPVHSDGSVTLIRQLRPAVGAVLLEVPAGRLGAAEDPSQCAARELLEETGLTASSLIPLGIVYSSPGVFDEVVHLFAAAGLSAGNAQPEDDEDIEVLRLPFDSVLAMVADGRISDSKTVTAITRWHLRMQQGPL